MKLLIITAVEAESRAIGEIEDALIVAGGIGRTNAAAATTEAILKHGPFDAVLSAGVAGALPNESTEPLAIGDTIVASRCVYAEEGMITPAGWRRTLPGSFELPGSYMETIRAGLSIRI